MAARLLAPATCRVTQEPSQLAACCSSRVRLAAPFQVHGTAASPPALPAIDRSPVGARPQPPPAPTSRRASPDRLKRARPTAPAPHGLPRSTFATASGSAMVPLSTAQRAAGSAESRVGGAAGRTTQGADGEFNPDVCKGSRIAHQQPSALQRELVWRARQHGQQGCTSKKIP